MRRLLPRPKELAILSVLAAGCAAVASCLRLEDGLIVLMFPLVLAALLLGARRSGSL